MRYRYIFVFALACSYANNWNFQAGLGYGQHIPQPDNDYSSNTMQSDWSFVSDLQSDLYKGMSGHLKYILNRGNYKTFFIADDNVDIQFRASTSRGRVFLHTGMGLGINHRQNFNEDTILNQAYIPFYFDIRFKHKQFTPWKLSFQTNYYINLPESLVSLPINPITFSISPSVHYSHASFEYVLRYTTARFTQNTGIQGLNTHRIDGQVLYHFTQE